MTASEQNGAPSTATTKKQVGSADHQSPSEDMTFSSAILRALAIRDQEVA